MRRICRAVVVPGVTAEAICRGALVLAANMTGSAVQSGMGAGQRESIPGMIHLYTGPAVHPVALLAVGGEARGDVVRLRILVILRVAGDAICRQPEVLASGRSLVTGLTVHCGMSSEEREAVGVLLDRLDVDLPSFYGVARFAVRAELTLVNIGVTISTVLSGLTEHQAGMAFGAWDRAVHAAQWVLRFVMVEFRNIADRLPRSERMTVLAGHV